MSAYIVSVETIQKVVYGLGREKLLGKVAVAAGLYDDLDRSYRTNIGKALFALNEQAVNSRRDYGDRAPGFEFDWTPRRSCPIETFKALQCLAYQCDEKGANETPLFKALSETIEALAYKIVSETPEYKAAQWG